jgi:regulator of protease activity HflC (stomatin/prohibitin superfamily)
MSFGYIALAAVVTSTVVADRRADKVAKAQEKQAETEQAIQSEEAARAKRKTLAEAQVARAEVENVAAAGGQSLGSASITGQQSITGQAASNVSQINQSVDFANLRSEAAQDVEKAGRQGIGEMLLHKGAGVATGVLGTKIGKAL